MTLKELTKIVLEIRDNHLEHMKDDIDRIEKKVDKMDERIWLVLIILIGATFIPVIANFFSQ
jgi:hypothetical protein